MSESVYAGLTSQSIDLFLADSSSTTGAGLTGVVHNSAGLTCYYRKGATGTATVISLASVTVGGAWQSGGFVEVDSTNMPGVYRFDIPNTVVDSEGFVTIYFQGATNLVPTALRIDCRPIPSDIKKVQADSASATSLKSLVDTDFEARTLPSGEYFNPSEDTVARVTLVDTTTTNTDMRGTNSAALASSLPTNFSDLAITATTGRVTVGTNTDKTGYSISGTLTTLDALNSSLETYGDANWAGSGGSGDATEAKQDIIISALSVIDGIVDTILLDTDELQTNQGNWITATGFSTFNPATDTVARVTLVDTCTANTDMRGTDSAALASSLPSNFSDLAITATTGRVTVGTNADKTGYSISGTLTTLDSLNTSLETHGDANWSTGGDATESKQDTILAALGVIDGVVDSILLDTDELQTNQGNWLTATGFSTFNPATDTVARVTLVDTCSTNTDMRGTDSAALASSLPTNFADLAITASTGRVTVGTNNDKTGYSISGTLTTLDAINSSLETYGDTNWATATGFSTFDASSDSVNIGSILGTALTETTSGNVANNVSFFYDLNTTTTKTVDDVGTGGGGGGDATAANQATIIAALGVIDGNVDSILDDTATTIPALINALQDLSASDIANLVVEAQGSYTLQQALSVILSVLAGQSSNNGLTFKTPNGSATRVAATVDENKNRTNMNITPSA